MTEILIIGGRVVDPVNKTDEVLDVHVKNGRVQKIGKKIKADSAQKIDARGKVVAPGLIDLHVHLREPGFEYKEDLYSGLRSAVKGGFTGVCPMPNTKPVISTQADVEFLVHKAQLIRMANLYPIAAVTRGQRGQELTEFGELKRGGVLALSDDGHPLQDSNITRHALEYAKKFDLVLMMHCEDQGLFGSGCINEGIVSTKMGLRGIPVECESVEVTRDIQLADMTGSRLHFCHISSKKSLEYIREAKKVGSSVTVETCPHYFSLTEEAVLSYNTNAKMNPPLRTSEDQKAIKEALRDGTIDVIATDHAPHAEHEKDREFDQAPFGIIGLETALPLSLDLVRQKVLSLPVLIEKMSVNPAKILKIPRGSLGQGDIADITIFDPDKEWIFGEEPIESRSRNSPFLGSKLKGRATDVLVRGRVVLQEGKIMDKK